MSEERTFSEIDMIISHCTAAPNGRPDTIEDIDSWHAGRNFRRSDALRKRHQPHLKAVGYHYVIGIDGNVYEGRSLLETGAHVEGYNMRSVGVCLLGEDQFSKEQWHSLRSKVESLIKLLPNDNIDVVGHKRLNNRKDCPGFDVQKWLDGGKQPLAGHILAREA